MKSFLFDLSKTWSGVLEFFEEMVEIDTLNVNDNFEYFDIDIHKMATCWLSLRIYKKTNAICLSTMEICLPFEVEIAMFNDPDALINNDFRLRDFEDYLDFINLNDYNLSSNIDIKVINRVMIITKL